MHYRFWQFIHNAVAHPLEGFVVLLLGYCPDWLTRFHDWTVPSQTDTKPESL